MKIYNTLSRKIEEFIPQDKNLVKMYVCGITPYDEVHVGHARCYITFDILRRYLKYKGYNVKYVQNFTDIDDKIISAAKNENVTPQLLAEKYINSYLEAERKLNILPADIYPRVTQHIEDIISAIEILINKGYAYVTSSGVYFSVEKFPSYGKLSKKNLAELITGVRIEPDETKKSAADFALWKFMKPDEPVYWESPWSKGRPGWHIECSVMSMKYLGETLDIHGGGMDLIFPHHENEIAQSESITGKQFVNYWVHNGFVTVNQQKMSKSLKNIFALNELFQVYHPMVVRLFLISQHYQKPLDFSLQELEQYNTVYQKFVNLSYEICSRKLDINETNNKVSDNVKKIIDGYVKEFEQCMDDNLNISSALAVIHKMVSFIYKLPKDKHTEVLYSYKKFLTLLEDILGIETVPVVEIPQEIQELLSKREQARKNKDYKTADEIRKKIFELGYIVEDTFNGPRVKKRL